MGGIDDIVVGTIERDFFLYPSRFGFEETKRSIYAGNTNRGTSLRVVKGPPARGPPRPNIGPEN
jgi:hypothetical protein